MPSKVGCGPVAAIVVILIVLLMGMNEAAGIYFVECEDDLIDCILRITDEEEVPEGTVAATGTYPHRGFEVTVTMNIPLQGGAVTGTVSGTCDGKVSGTYDGRQNGAISGKLTGACSPFFVNIPASAEFSGTVNKTGKTVPIGFNGQSGGFSHQGSMTLVFP